MREHSFLPNPSRIALALGAVCFALLGAGCQTNPSSPMNPTATISVQNRTLSQIETAVISVFQQSGFQGGISGPGQLRFERPASKFDQIAYADIFGGGVAVRAMITITPLDATTTTVSCIAQKVQNPGDPLIEESTNVRPMGSKPYQELLNQVEAKLK